MTWSVIKPEGSYMITPRAGHTATEISSNQFLVFGGSGGDRFYNDVHIFNVETNLWSFVDVQNPAQAPAGRHQHTANLIGEELYIIGGRSEKETFSDVWILDIATGEWSRVEASGVGPGHLSLY